MLSPDEMIRVMLNMYYDLIRDNNLIPLVEDKAVLSYEYKNRSYTITLKIDAFRVVELTLQEEKIK
jgi:hypothetical protein